MARVDSGPGDLRPPYMKIADELRNLITSGQAAVGETLPSYNEISRAHQVAVTTAQKAVDVLRAEGLVATTKGVGTYVIAAHPRAEHDDTAAMIAEVSRRLDALESSVRKIEHIIDQTLGSIRRSPSNDA